MAPCDGLNVWIPITANPDSVVENLAHQGWLVRRGDVFAIGSPVRALRVTASGLDAAVSKRFVRELRGCLQE
ncbi:hypothetical protein [Alkalilimnicola ehrlichii]|nr:hypothetical protein [Alkalilimnicola ehrlichii]